MPANNRNSKKHCDCCDQDVIIAGWARHCATIKHRKNSGVRINNDRKKGSGKGKKIKPENANDQLFFLTDENIQ